MRYALVLAAISLPFAVTAQNSTDPAQVTVTQLVVIVDGAKNPEQISDDLAYRHFLRAVATHEQPTAAERKRQHTFLGAAGLSDSDEKAIALELGKMTTRLEAVQTARSASDGAPATLKAFKDEEDTVISRARARVRQVATAEGLSRLDRYMTNTVKRNIKIYGLPNK